MHQDMPREQFSENWARAAVENPRVEPPAVRSAIRSRFGDKALIWSNDADANMQAMDKGYRIVHPRSLGKEEARNLRELGGMLRTRDLFARDREGEEDTVDTSGDIPKQEFARWVIGLGEMAGKKVVPTFVKMPRSRILACCTMNSQNPQMKFNLALLEGEWFKGRGPDQLGLVIHELGHAEADGAMSHGPTWGEACTRVAARIALGMAEKQRETR